MGKAKFLLVASGLILLHSCGKKAYYESYKHIPNAIWYAEDTAFFDVEVKDTSSEFLIVVNLRNNNDYPKSNIYFFREIRSSRGIEFRDTISYFLADNYGKWLGQGIGELKTNQWPFAPKGLRFRKKDTYTFVLTQAMRLDSLPGVEDVGITLYKDPKED